jgi:hypothetical protein
MSRIRLSGLFLSLTLALVLEPTVGAAPPTKYPPPKTLGDVATHGRNLARSLRLLETSTPAHKNTVKVLFYGQSITEQEWTRQVMRSLRDLYPNAHLIMENRAIGGHAAQLLVKTAEADLYPFYPDLVIFQVYGSHIEYENIIKRIRERTTADILMQTDHLAANDRIDEPTDPAKLSPQTWNPWMNYVFLPQTARRYQTELADQRNLWKQYLRDNNLEPAALLKDGVHLNDHGNFLMAEIVTSYLRPVPSQPESDTVRTLEVGRDVAWKDGTLSLPFEGNRVVAICGPGGADRTADVRIDGKKPSEIGGDYAVSRTSLYPGSGWPIVLKVGAEAPRVAEAWTLTFTELSPDLKQGRFRVEGSVSGPDGTGSLSERFVSKSGRVVIEPDDWNLDFCLRVFKRTIQAGQTVTWKALLMGTDTFRSPGVSDPAVETTVTLAQGLTNGPHRLELKGGPEVPVKALRVYRPPLGRASER